MASRTSTRKARKKRSAGFFERRPRRLELLFSAAMALPGLALVNDAAAQSAADSTTLSLGYLGYQDHQKNVEGVSVQSPTLYFKLPLGPRTEIEGGLVYDSVSGASAFRVAPQPPQAAPPPVVAPLPPPPCRIFPINTLARASGGGGGGGGGGSHGGSSGGSSGGSPSNPICSNNVGSGGGTSGSGGGEFENDDGEEGGHGGGESDRILLGAKAFDDSINRSFTDDRFAGDVKVTQYFDTFSIGSGIALSTENDYDSLAGLVESRVWTPDKNTTFAFGVAADFDKITASNDPSFSETKDTQTVLVGVTQVVSPNSIVQSNVTFANDDGYLSDVYEPGDNRPGSRQAFAWLTRYNHYIEEFDAALHLDYRLYDDSWGVLSHMVEAAWYQPLNETFTLRPGIRYYSQSNADFYSYTGIPLPNDSHFSADQRLSAFGGITLGLKLIAELGAGFSGSVGFDYLTQSSDLYMGSSSDSNKRDSLDAEFVFVEITKVF